MIEKLPSNITVTFPPSQNHVKGTAFVCPNCGLETGLKAESHGVIFDRKVSWRENVHIMAWVAIES